MYTRNSTTPLYFSVRNLDGTVRDDDVDFRYISGTSSPTDATNAATHLEGGVWRIVPTAAESNQDAWAIYPVPASETDDLVWGAIGNYPTRKSSGVVDSNLERWRNVQAQTTVTGFPPVDVVAIDGGTAEAEGLAAFVLDYGASELNVNLNGNVVGDIQGDVTSLTAAAINAIRNAITGGAWALSTDSNGRIRVVSGTGAGEISLSSGQVVASNMRGTDNALLAANYVEPLDAEGIRDAIGLDTPNLDTQLSGISTAIGEIDIDTEGLAQQDTLEAVQSAVNATLKADVEYEWDNGDNITQDVTIKTKD